MATPSFMDRASAWYADNKIAAWTIAGVTVIVTGGTVYYLSQPPAPSEASRKAKKERKKAKKGGVEASAEEKKAEPAPAAPAVPKAAVVEEQSEDLPHVTEESVAQLSEQERKDYAAKLKAAGNKAYGSKDYNRAIDLYTQAILCKADPVFYSNRAACWNAMSNWAKVIEDTTAAINLDAEYVKALNRRANAYEQEDRFSEALLDYTASCIIDQFRNESSAQSVERLLKKVAESKAKSIMAKKEKKLPSPTFVSNYLQSFRARDLPAGLEKTADLAEGSGKWYLRKGLQAIQQRTGEGYAEAAESFDQAIERNDLDKHEAQAYNMRGTFRYLRGENEAALEDLNKSIELDSTLVQSYVKRASMHLENSARDAAAKDFEDAASHNPDDPDIYYHRAQLHFILSEFSAAATDYQKSIDLDGDFIFSHIQLGVTQYKMGSIASSMATFRRCIKNFGNKSDVYNYYGELLLDQQKYQEAVEKFETAVEMERKTVGERGGGMNVLPLINKALALFQWKQDFGAAEELCQKALIIDPECDIAVATMAQLLLQQGKVTDALTYFERAAELSRTEGEIVNALSYAEATRTQLEVQEKYPQLAAKLQGMGAGGMGAPMR
ncbi:probable TOM-70 mitochondrial precursor protein import receptor tom70 [Ramularia collo-cygni]|uniref:Probable TOM-70 mitochondrial protein import receptor tom70 n=1 Tax=Ramularia collo-cygni TaxID=112498 RepID=A0A2D3VGW5_9PEZI|nr:probable TOM-70 mitochondrial precursor protein import receptor tom70 [Ramularia collo-cygni]CZT21149.1 probable TOM-70 mitochondrial precursor protein import receptor tom70 [Ramularia collo-cygni]